MECTRREMMRNVGLGLGAASLSMFGLPHAVEAAGGAGGGDGTESRPYALPPLPYAVDALEPHLDKETLALHHDKHHAAYVNGLNAALGKLEKARTAGDLAAAGDLTKAVAFHGSGHALHSLYWTSMKAGGGGKPEGLLAKLVERDFGSLDSCLAHLTAVTTGVAGSGWGVLAFEPLGRRLLVLGLEKHENVFFVGAVPLLVCDVWEHAYYLKYQNKRPDYVAAFMKNLIDWDSAGKRLAAAVG